MTAKRNTIASPSDPPDTLRTDTANDPAAIALAETI